MVRSNIVRKVSAIINSASIIFYLIEAEFIIVRWGMPPKVQALPVSQTSHIHLLCLKSSGTATKNAQIIVI